MRSVGSGRLLPMFRGLYVNVHAYWQGCNPKKEVGDA